MLNISSTIRIIFTILGSLFGGLTGLISPVHPDINDLFCVNKKKLFKKQKKKKSTREPIRGWIITIIFLVFSIFFSTVAAFAPGSPQPMTGQIRVLILPFKVIGQSQSNVTGDEISKDISGEIVNYLKNSLSKSDEINNATVWGSEEVAKANYKLRESILDQPEAINDFAQRIGADLVIYGTITSQENSSGFLISPYFIVSQRAFYQADEILGQYLIGKPFLLPSYSDQSDRNFLLEKLSPRIEGLSKIIIGLAHYSYQDYQNAQNVFQEAENISGWGDDEGKEVLYLLTGNSALKQNNLDLAEKYYNKSLSINQSYARPWLGLGEIYYHRALDEFQKTNNPSSIDKEKLQQAMTYIQKALESKDKPTLSDISLKSTFLSGEINYMLCYSGNLDSYDPALRDFTSVIDAFDSSHNERIKEIASESYGWVGTINSQQGNTSEALSNYDKASKFAVDPERKLFFVSMIKTLTGITSTQEEK